MLKDSKLCQFLWWYRTLMMWYQFPLQLPLLHLCLHQLSPYHLLVMMKLQLVCPWWCLKMFRRQ